MWACDFYEIIRFAQCHSGLIKMHPSELILLALVLPVRSLILAYILYPLLSLYNSHYDIKQKLLLLLLLIWGFFYLLIKGNVVEAASCTLKFNTEC